MHMPIPVKIFVVYAHEDKVVRDKLLRQLRPLADKGDIDLWSDHEIKPGALWDEEIRGRLADSGIILLLVSDDFFASDYIRRVEFETALELQAQGRARILPVIARHCGWADLPALSRLQVLPPEGRPVLSKEWDSPDEPYLKIYEGVRSVVREMHHPKQKIAPPANVTGSVLWTTNLRKWLAAIGLLALIVFGMVKWLPRPNLSVDKSIPDQPPFDSLALRRQKQDTTPVSSLPVSNNTDNSKKNGRKEKQTFTNPETSKQPDKRGDSLSDSPFISPSPPLFDEKLETVEDMTRIRKGRQQSFLNKDGKWIGIWFDDAENFHNGMAYVRQKNRYFWIDKKGECVKGCD